MMWQSYSWYARPGWAAVQALCCGIRYTEECSHLQELHTSAYISFVKYAHWVP